MEPFFESNRTVVLVLTSGKPPLHSRGAQTMINRNTLLTLAVSLTAVPVFAAPVTANKYEQAELDQEVRSCLAELGSQADYADATQVRHEVVVTKRRTLGHKLDVQTSVFSDSSDNVIRAYATKCIVYRDNKPVKFEFRETDAGT
jgi:hypothetical protein